MTLDSLYSQEISSLLHHPLPPPPPPPLPTLSFCSSLQFLRHPRFLPGVRKNKNLLGADSRAVASRGPATLLWRDEDRLLRVFQSDFENARVVFSQVVCEPKPKSEAVHDTCDRKKGSSIECACVIIGRFSKLGLRRQPGEPEKDSLPSVLLMYLQLCLTLTCSNFFRIFWGSEALLLSSLP